MTVETEVSINEVVVVGAQLKEIGDLGLVHKTIQKKER